MTPREALLEKSPPTLATSPIAAISAAVRLARQEPECQVRGSCERIRPRPRPGAARKLSDRMVFTRRIDRPIAGREPPSDLRVIASRHATRRTALRRRAIGKNN